MSKTNTTTTCFCVFIADEARNCCLRRSSLFSFAFATNVLRDEYLDHFPLRFFYFLDLKLPSNMFCVMCCSVICYGNFLLWCFRLQSQTRELLMKLVFAMASKFKIWFFSFFVVLLLCANFSLSFVKCIITFYYC